MRPQIKFVELALSFVWVCTLDPVFFSSCLSTVHSLLFAVTVLLWPVVLCNHFVNNKMKTSTFKEKVSIIYVSVMSSEKCIYQGKDCQPSNVTFKSESKYVYSPKY